MKTMIRIFTICLFFVSITVNAQNPKIEKKADEITAYVKGKMSLDDAQSKLLRDAVVARNVYRIDNSKGKDLTKEEKKAVKKAAGKLFKTKLEGSFSETEIESILKYLKEYREEQKAANN